MGEWLVALKEAAEKCTPADKALQVIANNDLFLGALFNAVVGGPIGDTEDQPAWQTLVT